MQIDEQLVGIVTQLKCVGFLGCLSLVEKVGKWENLKIDWNFNQFYNYNIKYFIVEIPVENKCPSISNVKIN